MWWQSLLIGCVPAFLSFGVGIVIGYGRATARISVLETNVQTLTVQMERLENILLFGHPDGGRRRSDVRP